MADEGKGKDNSVQDDAARLPLLLRHGPARAEGLFLLVCAAIFVAALSLAASVMLFG